MSSNENNISAAANASSTSYNLFLSLSYKEEVLLALWASPLAIEHAQALKAVMNVFHNFSDKTSQQERLNAEKTAISNNIRAGRINRTEEALQYTRKAMLRVNIAAHVLELSQSYETYEVLIRSCPDKNFDGSGLPLDAVRVFIASQLTVLRNNAASDTCSQDDHQFFIVRIDNLRQLEKSYKQLQLQHMQTFAAQHPDLPAATIFLSKQKNISI